MRCLPWKLLAVQVNVMLPMHYPREKKTIELRQPFTIFDTSSAAEEVQTLRVKLPRKTFRGSTR
jgi:hypothetical protein